MNLFETFGEKLSRVAELLPPVVAEHYVEVDEAPDVIGRSVLNQFGAEESGNMGAQIVGFAETARSQDSFEPATPDIHNQVSTEERSRVLAAQDAVAEAYEAPAPGTTFAPENLGDEYDFAA